MCEEPMKVEIPKWRVKLAKRGLTLLGCLCSPIEKPVTGFNKENLFSYIAFFFPTLGYVPLDCQTKYFGSSSGS